MRSSTSVLAVSLVILAAALTRLLPHWPNFTPILAMALVGGVYAGSKKIGYVIPLAAMLVSDFLLGLVFDWSYTFHSTAPWVYGSMIAITAIGRLFATSKPWQTVMFGGTIAGILFFLVTNAGVWFSGTMYPHTAEGLAQAYIAGLDFYRDSGNYLLNGVVSTWVFSAGMLMVLALLDKRRQHVPA